MSSNYEHTYCYKIETSENQLSVKQLEVLLRR